MAADPPETGNSLGAADLRTLLGLAHQVIGAGILADLAAAGYDEIRPVHGLVLQALQTRDGATSGELSEILGISQQEAGQLVKDLHRRGYLCSTPHPGSNRRIRYVMTDRAQQQLRAFGYVTARQEARLSERIGAEALADLRGRLADLIRAQVGDDVPPLRPQR